MQLAITHNDKSLEAAAAKEESRARLYRDAVR